MDRHKQIFFNFSFVSLTNLLDPRSSPNTQTQHQNTQLAFNLPFGRITMEDQASTTDAQCPTWAASLGYMGVAAAVCLSNWGSAVSRWIRSAECEGGSNLQWRIPFLFSPFVPQIFLFPKNNLGLLLAYWKRGKFCFLVSPLIVQLHTKMMPFASPLGCLWMPCRWLL